MGENKRYFWLKLFDNFFSSKRIKRLRQLAGGDTYTIIYLKMQLKALKDDGYLYFDGLMGDFAEELALDIDEKPDDVKMTIQYLLSVGLIECSDSGEEWYLTYMKNCIGSETASAQRSRKFRQKQKEEKALQCNTDETLEKRLPNVEIDIEIDKNIDINISKNQHQKDVDVLFESLWKSYVRKEGKSQVKKKSKEEIYKIGYNRMIKCIEKYKSKVANTDKQYILMGSTFFNGRYKDYLEEEKPVEESKPLEEEHEMSDEEWAAMYEPGGKMYVEPEGNS